MTPDVERHQVPRSILSAAVNTAVKNATDLDQPKASALLLNLPHGEEPDNFRASLLAYYAGKGASDPAARKARRDLILWLITTYPQDTFLSSHYAIVNAAGEPLADPEAVPLIKQAWLDAVKQYPDDLTVLQGALNFLRVVDPHSAFQLVAAKPKWDQRPNWIGSIYAYASLGISAVAPNTGGALAAAPADAYAHNLRDVLMKATDLRAVLSAMSTTATLGRSLAAHNNLPSDFPDFCQALLKHTRDLYPQTSLACDTSAPPPSQSPSALQRIGGNVMEANLIRKVQPVFPSEAKAMHAQGTVEFTATIGKDGHIETLQLVRGPFVFYQASYDAVIQWQYRPTMLNGNPVSVITDIIVNYTFSTRP